MSVTLGIALEFSALVDCLSLGENSLSHCSGARDSGVILTLWYHKLLAGHIFWSSLLTSALWMSWDEGDWGPSILGLPSLWVWVKTGWWKGALGLLATLTRNLGSQTWRWRWWVILPVRCYMSRLETEGQVVFVCLFVCFLATQTQN